MTHVQKYWSAKEALNKHPSLNIGDLNTIRSWVNQHPTLPKYINDEQLVLFLHSCYSDIENTKKCIEEYYRLRIRVPQLFEFRDFEASNLKKTLNALDYGILPVTNPEGYKIVYHKLNDTDPANYCFNDGFKLLIMAIDALYIKEGPQDGLLLLFDLKGVKLGHLAKLPILNVKRALEYIQDANPVRLKGIHVLNVHPIIDKIMMIIRPFLRKQFISLLHFHKEGAEEVYKTFPNSCLPKEYGGELETAQYYHDNFLKEMKKLRPLYLEETELMFGCDTKKSNKKNLEASIDIAKLEID